MFGAVVQCDDCQFIFPTVSALYTKIDDDGAEVVGFTCPKCKKDYVAYRTNNDIKELQNKVAREREKANRKVSAGVNPSKAYRKTRQAQRALEKEMEKLNVGRG